MMIDLDKWDEILQAITRNKTRSLLTAFGIFWGIFMLVFLMGGGKGLKAMLDSNFEGVSKNSYFILSGKTTKGYKGYQEGRTWNLKPSDLTLIKHSIPTIDVITPMLGTWGVNTAYKEKQGTAMALKGLYPEYQRIETPTMSEGRFINQADINNNRRVCVIGGKIRDELFPEGGNPLGAFIKVGGVYYQVIGVNSSVSNFSAMGPATRSVIIPYTTFAQIYNIGDNIPMLAASFKPGIDVTQEQELVRSVVRRVHDIAPDDDKAIRDFNMATLYKLIENLFDGINILVWLIGIGTLLAGAVGVSNIMMVTVSERTVEIGIRRAIGAKPRDILWQILSESIVLTIIAGLLGICFATGMLAVLEYIATSSNGIAVSFQVSFSLALAAAALLTLLGALAGLLPAFKALAVKPIEAIRDE